MVGNLIVSLSSEESSVVLLAIYLGGMRPLGEPFQAQCGEKSAGRCEGLSHKKLQDITKKCTRSLSDKMEAPMTSIKTAPTLFFPILAPELKRGPQRGTMLDPGGQLITATS